MPLGVNPTCSQCEVKESAMWRKFENNLLCSLCFEKQKEGEKIEIEQKIKVEEAQLKSEHVEQPKPLKAPLRKSARMTRNYKTRGNPYAAPKPTVGRGRSRKGLQKRTPMRSHLEGRSWVKTNRAYLVEGFLRTGDIVSLCDAEDNIYYAQLRGFVGDVYYGEKLGVLSWLLPKVADKKKNFNVEDYYLGPDEDTPRRLDNMELVYRIPAKCKNFYKLSNEIIDNYESEAVHI